MAAAKNLCLQKELANVLQFGLPQLNSAGTKETGQTVSHHQVELAGTLLVALALASGGELVVAACSELQHSIFAQLMLVKILVAWMLLHCCCSPEILQSPPGGLKLRQNYLTQHFANFLSVMFVLVHAAAGHARGANLLAARQGWIRFW